MIHQYIRDPQLKSEWDLSKHWVKAQHLKITREYISAADLIRDGIRQTDAIKTQEGLNQFHKWIWGNINTLQEGALSQYNYPDEVMNAYLEWGSHNYPITSRISKHILQCLESHHSGDPDAMVWDYFIDQIEKIVIYQAEQNEKPSEKMNRAELIRWISGQDETIIRKMVTAVRP